MFKIDESIGIAFPGTSMGILIMKNVSASQSYEGQEVTEVMNVLHQKYAGLERKELKELSPIQAYVSYYKKFGDSYPVLAQLESVLKGKKSLPAEAGLLQTMFLTELEGMLLTAGYDLSKLQLPLLLKTADGTEIYQSISGKEVVAVNGDMMLCDTHKTISSILRGPDYESRITEATTEVLFSIYATPGIESAYIETNLQKLEKRIKALAPSAKTELLQVFSC